MLSRNNSYFDPQLCIDGHYIITGRTNDRFCSDTLELTDILPVLHHYLLYEQGFDAVFFLDNENMLFCLDRHSFDVLTLPPDAPEAGAVRTGAVSADGPLGRRRRRNAAPEAAAGRQQDAARPLNMGRMSLQSAWQQVSGVMKHTEARCALVISNANMMKGGEQLLLELSSFYSTNHSVVLYLFRETTLNNVAEWTTFARNVLLPRITTTDPIANRVISLSSPNSREVRNLLNRLRFDPGTPVPVQAGDIPELGSILAASCARNNWGLVDLLGRLYGYASAHPDRTLTLDNWREYTEETSYRSAMEELEAMVGQEKVKQQLRAMRADQECRGEMRIEPLSSSRFAPLPVYNRRLGHSLNVRLKGSAGTGKTTIAQVIGRIYYDLGLLSRSYVRECSAADLVSGYVNHTAEQVRQLVQEAMGGVLFIDEAYALMDGQHGQEAINQLVHDMSAYEGQFAVILAGYSHQIDQLMRTNEGLSSRFPNEYVLEDYTPAEMQAIFRRMAARELPPVTFSPSLEARMDDFFETWVSGRGPNWGNARECQNLLPEMKKLCSLREAALQVRGRSYCLTEADVPERLRHCLEPRSNGPSETMARIDAMIGLGGIKRFLRHLVQRILMGEREQGPGNFIFFGPPGTGKTTVARQMGELLGLLRVLPRRHVVECRAADLLNGSVQLSEAVESARGGVFFLDEAHQLAETDHGQQIIRALVPLVEDPDIRADTCFICAGYADRMRHFLSADAGMNRRFPLQNRIRFYDYTAEELVQILEKMARDRGQEPDEEYLQRSLAALDAYMPRRPADFGNAGFIRDTFLPGSIDARTRRLNIQITGSPDAIATDEQLASLTEQDRRRLTAFDLPEDFARMAGPVGRRPSARLSAWQRVQALLGKDEIISFARARAFGSGERQFFDAQTQGGLHYAITGPSGCGRHTAVRALAALWREAGLLERDDVIFAGNGDLVAGYVGQTAGKTQRVIEQAVGGTLVIEYPSSLLPKNNENSFGPEALGTIASAMAAHFGDTSFVLLDTPEGMEALFKAQPALRGQMARIFELEDLTPVQMESIFREKTRDSMMFEDSVEELLSDFFLNWVSNRGGLGDASRSWANGMEVDRLIEDLKINWKNSGGQADEQTVTENGRSYQLVRRRILAAHFPRKVQRYLKRTSVVSESALQELQALPGLHRVKRSVQGIQRRIRRLGRTNSKPGCYLYLGNPGVGKTTVARLMGGVLHAAGVLSQGHVIERTARQIGDQLNEFDSILKLARGGILFIDEAHQLAEPQNYWGREIIKRLLTVLEDDAVTNATCIILAGYPQSMIRLLEQDEGLASRFGSEDNIIVFDDYTADELMQVMEHMAARADRIPSIGAVRPLVTNEEFRRHTRAVFEAVLARGDHDFGNARFVRTYLHDALNAQLERMDREYGEIDDPPADVADLLTEQDIPERYRHLAEESRRQYAAPDPARMDTRRGAEVDELSYDAACEQLSRSVVLLEITRGGRKTGTATGTIVTSDGLVLTCAHVIRGAERIRARVYCPGAPGGDTRWFDSRLLEPVCSDCDMAMLQLDGNHFVPAPLRPLDQPPAAGERTLILGYPLGGMLAGGDRDALRISNFSGRVASCQLVGSVERCYVDSTGLHGNSGSPVFSMTDRRVIGVFSGSIIPRQEGSLDELNYFHPLHYFWERFAAQQPSVQPGAAEEEENNGSEN
ncbi:MAG: AAA family ATPase [Oscillospiraceae bacterium]|nr:AAA family ATPase [Oscillospiraceae bacterium]